MKFSAAASKYISRRKPKRNPKLKKQETGAVTRNDFFLKNIVLDVALQAGQYMFKVNNKVNVGWAKSSNFYASLHIINWHN